MALRSAITHSSEPWQTSLLIGDLGFAQLRKWKEVYWTFHILDPTFHRIPSLRKPMIVVFWHDRGRFTHNSVYEPNLLGLRTDKGSRIMPTVKTKSDTGNQNFLLICIFSFPLDMNLVRPDNLYIKRFNTPRVDNKSWNVSSRSVLQKFIRKAIRWSTS